MRPDGNVGLSSLTLCLKVGFRNPENSRIGVGALRGLSVVKSGDERRRTPLTLVCPWTVRSGGISWAGATMSDMMRAFKPLRSRRRNNKRQPSRLPPLDKIEPVFVDQRPERFEHGKLYICGSGSWSGHLCACGCGEIIDVGFHDATWQMLFNGKVTIYPSIGNNHLPCRAHYVIRENKVVWYGYVPSLRSKRP